MSTLSKLQHSARRARTRAALSIAAHPRLGVWAILGALALFITVLTVPSALAAVQLNYFTVISFPSSVTLEWSTSSEVNLAGFDIQCKLSGEPDSAFHEIGYVRAKGGPDVGALYSFPVTSGVVPGQSYCFRLKEITTDGSPGEVFDRCGYGPQVTPTPGMGAIPVFTPIPVQTDAFGNPIPPTPTVQVVPTDAFGNPIPQVPQPIATDAFGNPISPLATPQPFATDAFGNPIPQVPPAVPPAVPTDAFGNPLPTAVPTDAFGNPLPPAVPTDAFGNPLPPTPTPFNPQSPLAPAAAALPATGAVDAYGNPIPPAPAPGAFNVDAYGNPLPTAPVSPLPAPAAFDQYGNPLAPAAVDQYGNPLAPAAAFAPNSAGSAAQDPAAQYVQPATPTVAYIVVTATPTPAPVALAPVLTPLATATPLPQGLQLAATLQPSGQNLAQNLMVMLLCLTFTGAGGIGLLGLITSVMFMRARSSQRDFYERTSVRRRY